MLLDEFLVTVTLFRFALAPPETWMAFSSLPVEETVVSDNVVSLVMDLTES